ncbi:MAG: hypothetical protein HGB08_01685 [Candidatus Moranbacteria bacterium]|nr:hypothetical protein [Candidatus Moranbacteria bacterium]
MPAKKTATVIWAREVKLNQFLAKELGSEVIISHKKKIGTFDLPAPFRYVWQSFDTYRKLRAIKPDAVLVMNPPIVAPFIVYIYCLFNKSRFIIDTHTAGFLDFKWNLFHPIHRFLARRAILNTVHNYRNLEVLERWGIRNGYVLPFCNPKKEEIYPQEKIVFDERIEEALRQTGMKVFMVNRFAGDDAWQEAIETARLMPEAIFFITGDNRKASIGDIPENVIMTGYLEHAKFIKLMDLSDVILALTKRKDTVLWSVREIMALRKPFVTTDNDVLRRYYGEVGIFTTMEPSDMREQILEAREKATEISHRMDKFLREDSARWNKDIMHIRRVISP